MFHLCDLCANCQTAGWLREDECYCWKRSWMVPTAKVAAFGSDDPELLCGDFERGEPTCRA